MDEMREMEERSREQFEAQAVQKLETLKEILGVFDKVAIAFSGGVDSAFLLTVARSVLGERAVAMTALLAAFPKREATAAQKFCVERDIPWISFPFDEFSIQAFKENPPDRCYHCKKAIFTKMREIALDQGYGVILEGTNADDETALRPGFKALTELGIISPLQGAKLTKEEIRFLSREMGLPTWDKKPQPCLASRIAYGDEIDLQKLEMVERSEQLLLDLGFSTVRVRMHGTIARIEVGTDDFQKFTVQGIRERIVDTLKGFGFSYVTVDLKEYRAGSLHEALDVDL